MRRNAAMALVAFLCTCGMAAHAAGPVKIKPSATVYQGEKRTVFVQPEGVGCGNGATFFVADSGNGRLLRYSVGDGEPAQEKEYRLRELPYPVRVRVGSKGDIFVLDGRLRKIARISPAGDFAGYVSVNAPGAENLVARSFTLDGRDNLYLMDLSSGSVLVASASGVVSTSIRFPDTYGFMSDVAVDASGSVFLLDSVQGKIHVARAGSGSFSVFAEGLKQYSNFPVALALDGKGYIYVLDRNGGRIVVLGRDGAFQGQQLGMGWKEGLLRYPSQLCVDGDGRLMVADEGNNRIQVFSLTYE